MLLTADGSLRAWRVDARASLTQPYLMLKARVTSREGALNITSCDGSRLVVDVLMPTLGGSSPAEWIQMTSPLDASSAGTLDMGGTRLDVYCHGGVRAAVQQNVLTTRGYRCGLCCR